MTSRPGCDRFHTRPPASRPRAPYGARGWPRRSEAPPRAASRPGETPLPPAAPPRGASRREEADRSGPAPPGPCPRAPGRRGARSFRARPSPPRPRAPRLPPPGSPRAHRLPPGGSAPACPPASPSTPAALPPAPSARTPGSPPRRAGRPSAAPLRPPAPARGRHAEGPNRPSVSHRYKPITASIATSILTHRNALEYQGSETPRKTPASLASNVSPAGVEACDERLAWSASPRAAHPARQRRRASHAGYSFRRIQEAESSVAALMLLSSVTRRRVQEFPTQTKRPRGHEDRRAHIKHPCGRFPGKERKLLATLIISRRGRRAL